MSNFDYESLVTDIVDYPTEGVVFKDITTLLKDPEGYHAAIEELTEHFKDMGVTKVVGSEARGFMVGAPLAYNLGAGFVPARKRGKLPREVIKATYALEYGLDALEMHVDAIEEGDIVLLADDLIATGGTAVAQYKLVSKLGGKVVGLASLIELDFLNPRETLSEIGDFDIYSLIHVK